MRSQWCPTGRFANTRTEPTHRNVGTEQELKPLRGFSLPVPAVRGSPALFPQGHPSPLQLCPPGSQGHQPGQGLVHISFLTLDLHVHSLHGSGTPGTRNVPEQGHNTDVWGSEQQLQPQGSVPCRDSTNLLSCSYQGAGGDFSSL